MQPVVGPHTSWPVLCEHTDLMVMFGGMAPKNTQVNLGGVGRHEAQGWLHRVRQSGTEFINISPMRSDAGETLDADWLPIRPNSDTALTRMLYPDWHFHEVEITHSVAARPEARKKRKELIITSYKTEG